MSEDVFRLLKYVTRSAIPLPRTISNEVRPADGGVVAGIRDLLHLVRNDDRVICLVSCAQNIQ